MTFSEDDEDMNITGDSIRRPCNCPVIQLALNGIENDTGLGK